MGTVDRPTPRPVPARRPTRWLWPAVICTVVVVGLVVSAWTAVALFRPSAPRAYRIRMATNNVPMRVYLADAIRKEGGRRNLDVVLTARPYGTLEALDEIDTRDG